MFDPFLSHNDFLQNETAIFREYLKMAAGRGILVKIIC